MKKFYFTLVTFSILCCSVTCAQVIDNLLDGSGKPVSNGLGVGCWRDSFWMPATGAPGCEGSSTPENQTASSDSTSRFWILQKDMVWEIGNTGVSITVPAGFVTDFASVPRTLWSFGLSPLEDYTQAAIVHDFLYWSQSCTKPQADNLLYIAMKESEVSWFKSWTVYQGVAKGGDGAWEKNKAEAEAGWAKVAPPEWREIPAGITWLQQRQAMRAKGVRDPIFAKNPAFCRFGDSSKVPYDPSRPSSAKLSYSINGDLVKTPEAAKP